MAASENSGSAIWSPDSWRERPAKQQPRYEDEQHLRDVCATIRSFPPLVYSGEIDSLKQLFAEAAAGERFVLQGGDCAERFQDCHPNAITSKLKILLQMSLILTYGARRPVVRVGRIAGQYGKPRSNDTETVDGQTIPVFRGDNVNSYEADSKSRTPDPERLLTGYYNSSMTLNFIRALITGGFANLQNPEHWDLNNFVDQKQKDRYGHIIEDIKNAISFASAIGANLTKTMHSVDFYTSHEGLLLEYETALTKKVPFKERFYDLSAHMLWIGDRTRQLNGAHVEFFRGVANPIGIKIGPTADPKETISVIKAINPEDEQGKIVLISRFGQEKVSEYLGKFIEAIQKAKVPVLWQVDPMHGNIEKTKAGTKTRNFDAILSEVEQSFRVHREKGSVLGGVHFEMTGDNVTECIGGSEQIGEADLTRNYETYCDPRLNYSQSLEVAFLIASMFQR